jgi:hypothetical protein
MGVVPFLLSSLVAQLPAPSNLFGVPMLYFKDQLGSVREVVDKL